MEKSAGNTVVHAGTVAAVFESGVDVAIVSEAACGNCKMKKACGMEETADKTVTVFTPDAGLFRVGEPVEVLMKQSMGYRAIAIAYLLPVVVVLAALAALVRSGVPELVSGPGALGFLAIYYMVIYRFRDRLGRQVRFEIRRPENSRTE
jgi:sigma-E factor negative regulatory protein RseC